MGTTLSSMRLLSITSWMMSSVRRWMSDLVEHELIEWTDSSEARQAQMECGQRMDARVEDMAGALDSLKQAFEEIRQAGIDAETRAFAAVD